MELIYKIFVFCLLLGGGGLAATFCIMLGFGLAQLTLDAIADRLDSNEARRAARREGN